jgi:hypothetical protein
MSELVSCPGCGSQVHRRANECPRCGYRAEIVTYQEQLSSLSTICSILTGFGLASLVSLATTEAKVMDSLVSRLAAGLWLFSSLLLLAILVTAEVLRRQEPSDTIIAMPAVERERFASRCERLLTFFSITLGIAALGVVLFGFQFSVVHGAVGIGGAVGGVLVILWALR